MIGAILISVRDPNVIFSITQKPKYISKPQKYKSTKKRAFVKSFRLFSFQNGSRQTAFVVKRGKIFGTVEDEDLGTIYLKPCPGDAQDCQILLVKMRPKSEKKEVEEKSGTKSA